MKTLQTLFLLSLAFCLSLRASDLKPEKISLQLAWKHQFQFAGYYMAKEKGFYEDANLEVLIREHSGSAEENTPLEEGSYAIGHSSLMAEIANAKRVKMLFAAFQSSPSVFIALKSSNIRSVKDFANKRIMLTSEMFSEVSLRAMLQKNGLGLDDMVSQKHSYDIESLLRGETDIMASYISNEPYTLSQKGEEFIIFDPAKEGFDFYSDILYASESEALNHRARLDAFVNASKRGWEYAFAHIDESVDLILQKYNTQNKSKEALLHEAKELKKLAYFEGVAFGSITKEKLQRMYDIYNVLGALTHGVELDEFLLPGNQEFLNSQELEYLKNKKVITMCVDPNWMPYEKIEASKHVGIAADYFTLIERMLKTKIELVETKHWEESLAFAKERKCDILSLALKTKSREEYLSFTEPYVNLSLVLATGLHVPFVDDFTHLKGKKIGVTKGFAFIEILKEKHPYLELVEVENTLEGLFRVVSKEHFGYVGGLADISYFFQKEFLGELQISGKFEEKWSHSIAARNDEPLLLEILQKALNEITPRQRKEIENRWISIQYNENKDYSYLWWLLAFVTLGLGASLLLNAKQKEINHIIEQQASRDYMTKLYNRRFFTESAEQILEHARRNNAPIAIVMIDIDNFKNINDAYGHSAGDETIKTLANIMLSQSRKSDLVVRWGGEEFVILLLETKMEDAVKIADKIRTTVEKELMRPLGSEAFRFTISAGVSSVALKNDASVEAAIVRSDKALYEAKRSGKNRVCVNVDEL